jgi:hypothetical protein
MPPAVGFTIYGGFYCDFAANSGGDEKEAR